MECPAPSCRESLITCLGKKVSRTVLGVFISVTLAFLSIGVGGPLLYSMAAEKKQNEKIAEIEIVKKDIEHIKEQVDKHEESLKRIEIQQQTIIQNQLQPDALKRVIREAVKEGVKK